jgi:hypothetical protein
VRILSFAVVFHLVWVALTAAFASKSPIVTNRNRYAIPSRRKETFVVLIGYILYEVAQWNLGAHDSHFL